MRAALRTKAVAAQRGDEGEVAQMSASEADEILAVVDAAMAAHADFDR